MARELGQAEIGVFRESLEGDVNELLNEALADGSLHEADEVERLASLAGIGMRDSGAPPELGEALARVLEDRGDVAAATLLETAAILVPAFRRRADEALGKLAAGDVRPALPPGTGQARVTEARRSAVPTGEMYLGLIERPGSELGQVAIVAVRTDTKDGLLRPLRECDLTPWGELDSARRLLDAPAAAVDAASEPVEPKAMADALDRALAAHREQERPIHWDAGLALPLLGLALRGRGDAFGEVGILGEGFELHVEPEDDEGFERLEAAVQGDFAEWLAETEADDALREAGEVVVGAMLRRNHAIDGRLGYWTVADIEEFLLEDAPRALPAEGAVVVRAVDAVASFLRFLSGADLLSGDRLHELLAECERLREEAGAAAHDRSRWGIGKTLIEQMQSEGVELTDQAALDAWLEDFNSRPTAERDRVLGPASDRDLLRAELGPDAELPEGLDSTVLPGRRGGAIMIGTAWFPESDYEAALERWSDLGELWDEIPHDEYCRRFEATMRGWSLRGVSPRPVRLELAAYTVWCEERDADPDESRAAYAADQLRTGNAIDWPPGRNEPCWCGSGRKYKRCCGTVATTATHPLDAEV